MSLIISWMWINFLLPREKLIPQIFLPNQQKFVSKIQSSSVCESSSFDSESLIGISRNPRKQRNPRAAAEKEPAWRLIGVNAIKRIAAPIIAQITAVDQQVRSSAIAPESRDAEPMYLPVCLAENQSALPKRSHASGLICVYYAPKGKEGEINGQIWISGYAIRRSKIAFILHSEYRFLCNTMYNGKI